MKYLIILLTAALLGCNTESTTSSRTYYDIDSLVTAQINYLSENAFSLKKISSMDTVLIKSNNINWGLELEIFRSLDINKPALSDSYMAQDKLDAANSNLTVLRYSPNYGQPTVQQIELHYLDRLDNLKRLKAKVGNSNGLFDSSREFYMEFEQIEGKSILSYYTIKGNQKLVMRDTLNVNISAEIKR